MIGPHLSLPGQIIIVHMYEYIYMCVYMHMYSQIIILHVYEYMCVCVCARACIEIFVYTESDHV